MYLLFFHSIFTGLSDQTSWSCFHSINYMCLTLPRCFLYLSYFTLLLILVIESLEYMSNSQDQLQDMPNQQFHMSQHRTCFASTHSSSFSLGSELDKNVKKPHILYKVFRDQMAEEGCKYLLSQGWLCSKGLSTILVWNANVVLSALSCTAESDLSEIILTGSQGHKSSCRWHCDPSFKEQTCNSLKYSNSTKPN